MLLQQTMVSQSILIIDMAQPYFLDGSIQLTI